MQSALHLPDRVTGKDGKSYPAVAARARSYYDAQAKARMSEGGVRGGQSKGVENLPPPVEAEKARDAAGKAVGVSGKSVDFATRVLAKGTPELIAAVDEGRMAVSTAAVVAADPPDVQREEAERRARRPACRCRSEHPVVFAGWDAAAAWLDTERARLRREGWVELGVSSEG